MNAIYLLKQKHPVQPRRRLLKSWLVLLLLVWSGSAGATVNFVLSPAAPNVTIGNNFTLEVRVEFNGGTLDAAEAHLNFDKNYLQVVSITRSALSILPTEPLPLSSIATMNASGQIGYAAGTASNFPSSNFVFLTIEFQAIQAGTTPITFNTIFPRKTDAQRLFTSILAGVSNANVTITALPTCFEDQTTAHFSLGSNANTYISQTSDGEVILNPAFVQEFSGTTLPSGWGEAVWDGQAGATTTYSGGQASLNGTHIYSNTTFAPGSTLEFVATYTAGNFQNVGFSADADFNNPWIMIGRGNAGDGNVYARTSNNQIVLLGTNLLGTPHKYRIEWKTDNTFAFYVDDVLIATSAITQTVSTNMVIQISDYPAGGASLSVDWVRVLPYATSGTFTSRVYDGGAAKNWGIASWTAIIPIGTSLQFLQRQGNTPTPDGAWTAFSLIPSNGALVSGTSRYIQYQAVLTTTNSYQTPILQDFSISCSSASCATLTSSDANNAICTGESVTFTASPTGGNYEFFLNGNIIQNGASNLYTTSGLNNGDQVYVIVTNAGGCSGTSSTIITTVSSPPTVSINPTLQTICPGQPATLNVNIIGGTPQYSVLLSNGNTYLISSSGNIPISPALSPTQTTVYSIQSITDFAGCVGTVTGTPATVNVSNLTATLSPPVVNPCAGDPITLPISISGGQPNYSVVINGVTYTNISTSVTVNPAKSLWNNFTVPGTPAVNNDNAAVELGVKFQSAVGGVITGVRFYKGVTNTNTYTGRLWSGTGTLLATVTFPPQTIVGWQEAFFSSPIPVNAGDTYVISYHTPVGSYAFDANYFTTAFSNAPLTALASGVSGGNGVFRYGPGGIFPENTFNAANYWVDVVFVSTSTATFNLTSITDANGCTVTGNPISSTTVTIDPNCGPLPVDLVDFKGWQEKDAIQLQWIVAAQKENDYMAVERSRDGKQFKEIGRRAGAGTTNILKIYDLLDEKPFSGINYYRLRQVDFDGKATYYQTIAVPFQIKTHGISIFPNPSLDYITVQWNQAFQEEGNIKITDLLGRTLLTFPIQAGFTAEQIDISQLAAATYIIALETKTEAYKTKFVKSTN